MGNLIKSLAGWLKIISYLGMLWGLAQGFMKPAMVVTVMLIISAGVKIAEIIVGLTPSKVDDDVVQKIKDALLKDGFIKKEDK